MSSALGAAQIREAFLTFFAERGHQRVASASLVPSNDPTLLFTNAGMVQFKDVFTGRDARPYQRATTTQKCVRAGGKHNDLDNVGFTPRHHTFFEMLGNFSFGNYFKSDAIAWAWEFVTQVLKIPKERLAVTVFVGADGIPADEEAYGLWAKTGVATDRIVRLGLADNFWAMGDTGPCGPCSEIYVYMPGGAPPPGNLPGTSEDWLEIWNLVFMQFERKVKDGPLLPLPKPSIDTGMGLERTTAVVQGKRSNYETDVFTPLLDCISGLAKKPYGKNAEDDASMRVVADHSRAAAFLIADGVQPSNEGRGYVLRRIMRRGIRHGARLGLDEPFFHQVVDAVITRMQDAFPELKEHRGFILEATRHEEDSFRRTLSKGLKLIDEQTEKLKRENKRELPGDVAFFLHDTHGFPFDLTEVIARERGFGVDRAGFDAALEGARSKSDAKLGSDKAIGDAYLALSQQHPETRFLGYDGDGLTGQGTVKAILKGGATVASAAKGDEVEVLLDQTPFYGESGGQVGDVGVLEGGGVSVTVSDAQKPAGGLVLHRGKVTQGKLEVGQALTAKVDGERRKKIRANHSATHLLHRALKVVLGDNVNQKGSVVGPDALRFDFSHFAPMTAEQLATVEDLVNGWVRDNADTGTELMALDAARAKGAVALFGEKYGAQVRVVTVHPESTELCGGTHVRRSGDIGTFRIESESSIASGVRRIVALTGQAALAHGRALELELLKAAELTKSPPREVSRRLEATQKRLKELERELEQAKIKASSGGADAAASKVREVNGIKVLTHEVDGADANVLRGLADRYKDQLRSGVIGLGTKTADGKALVLVAATKDLVDKGFKAGDAVRVMAAEVGGKGGGKADFAQAGGPDASRIGAALERLHELVKV
ncbi:MAG: alanine--tRNA ligase [Myxococcaceae bacterium]|nr:alanine--tRNA ligase [Myxococcaceae bacterium]